MNIKRSNLNTSSKSSDKYVGNPMISNSFRGESVARKMRNLGIDMATVGDMDGDSIDYNEYVAASNANEDWLEMISEIHFRLKEIIDEPGGLTRDKMDKLWSTNNLIAEEVFNIEINHPVYVEACIRREPKLCRALSFNFKESKMTPFIGSLLEVDKNPELITSIDDTDVELLEVAVRLKPESAIHLDDKHYDLKRLAVTLDARVISGMDGLSERLVDELVIDHPSILEHANNVSDALLHKAVSASPLNLQYIDNQSKELCEMAFKANPYSIRVMTSPSHDMMMKAVVDFDADLYYVKDAPLDICEIAVANRPANLKYATNQSLDMTKTAVLANPSLLEYAKEQDAAMCEYAVGKDITQFKFAQHQTDEMCARAVTRDVSNVQFVKNPTDDMVLGYLTEHPYNIKDVADHLTPGNITPTLYRLYEDIFYKVDESMERDRFIDEGGEDTCDTLQYEIKHITKGLFSELRDVVNMDPAKAVDTCPFALSLIDNPSEELCVAAVTCNAMAAGCVPKDKITPDVHAAALRYSPSMTRMFIPVDKETPQVWVNVICGHANMTTDDKIEAIKNAISPRYNGHSYTYGPELSVADIEDDFTREVVEFELSNQLDELRTKSRIEPIVKPTEVPQNDTPATSIELVSPGWDI